VRTGGTTARGSRPGPRSGAAGPAGRSCAGPP